jgi:transketolase
MAIAEKHLAAVFGDAVVNHKTYVIASDGDLMEGISQEAIALAGHLKLNKLIVLFDDNGISIDGALSLADSVDQIKRFEAAGWSASRIDGHDPAAIASALEKAQDSDKPVLIACRTKIGFGAPTKQGSEKSHGIAARRGGNRGSAQDARLDIRPVRGAGRYSQGLAHGGRAFAGCARGLEKAAGGARGWQTRRVRAPHAWQDPATDDSMPLFAR